MDDALRTQPKSPLPAPAGGSVLWAFCYWWVVAAPLALAGIWRNYLEANLNYFSIGLLLRTLIAPWHRDTEDYAKGFDVLRYLEAAIVNTMSRIIGFLIRIVTIGIGLVIELAIFAAGPLVFLVWFAAPFLLAAALAYVPTFHLTAPALPALSVPHLNFSPPVHGIR
ncbi:MAG TPA: hypothetical protein VMV50_00840 [Candidatus Paceibacterota bacterium]|nr:hypothetical protein [Candidatus Paceibacterota bacterium]